MERVVTTAGYSFQPWEHMQPLENASVRHMIPGNLTVILNFNYGSLAKAIVASNSIGLQHARKLKHKSTIFSKLG
jgi:hypothetical protein